MFEFLRNGVGSIFAGILLSLLIASFALWGIGDPLNTLGSSEIAEVGDEKITPNDLARAFESDYSALLQNAGEGVTRELAIQFGIGSQSAFKLIERKAYDVEARNLGLRTSDEELRDYIYAIQPFQDETGTFNRSYFNQYVGSQGYSISEFEEVLRSELVRGQFIDALMNNISVSDISADTLSKYSSEERVAEILSIPASGMTAIGEVTDEILTTFYEENADFYMAPEYRDVSYFEISASDIASTVEISDERALADYDARIADFTKEEQRGFIQMLLDDSQAADAAYAELEAGKSFEDVILDRTGATAQDSTFDAQPRADFTELYGEDAAELLYNAPENGYTSPIETGFGVYIFKMNALSAGSIDSFDDVKQSIVQDLQLDDAIDRLFDIRTLIDDELAAGAPIDAIADVIEIPLKKVSNVSVEGMTPDGTASDELPLIVEFLDHAFNNDVDTELELYEGISNKFYMLNIDNITDAVRRDFEDVRADVTADWEESRRVALSSELATKITDEYNASEKVDKSLSDFQDILSANLTINELTVDRANQDSAVSSQIHNSIFNQEIGGIEMIPSANQDGYVLVRVKQRTFGENVEEAALTETKNQIKTSYQNDIMGAYIMHLYSSLPVVTNNTNIEATLNQIATPAN